MRFEINFTFLASHIFTVPSCCAEAIFVPSGDHETVYSLPAPRWMSALPGTGVLECFGTVAVNGGGDDEMAGERMRPIVRNAAPPPASTTIPNRPLNTARREILL